MSLQSARPVHYSLGNGANVEDALYENDVKDVACMEDICNKKGLVMRGQIGRRGDRASGPLALDLPHVRPPRQHA